MYKMKKLKKFNLSNVQYLTQNEMRMLNGGEFISGSCNYEGQKCYVPAGDGINTGTCGWEYTSSTSQYLRCKT